MKVFIGRVETKYALACVGTSREQVKDALWEAFKERYDSRYWHEDFDGFDSLVEYHGGGITEAEMGKAFWD